MRTCPVLAELEAFAESGGAEAELAAHVAACPACGKALARVRDNMALLSDAIRPNRAALVAELGYAGSEAVPGYAIVREIHRGGQGVVFEALQRSTHRTVALKVLLGGDFAAEERRRRFEREIELVATLRHPNVVTIYDSGFLDDGRPFFAMEHVDGLTLDAFLRARNALPPPERGAGWTLADSLRLFAAICGAVEHAHRRGVIHRDLKPGNVLVDGVGVPRVLDFGLAKPVGETSVALTSPAEFLGTLAYAAPEQLAGDHLAIDTRTDVWALGVMLYEMVSGRSPHAGADRVAALVTAIETRDPPAPSASRGNEGRRGGWAELDAIVLRALAKEPERRYPSAGALGADVERLLAGEAVDARRDSTWYVVRKAARRHRGAVAAAAAFLALLIGASAGMGVLWRRSARAAESARHEADGAQAARDFLGDMLLAVDPDLAQGEEPAVREVLDEAARRIEDELADRPALRAEVRRFVGQAYRSLGHLDEARAQLEIAVAEARSVFGTPSAKVAEVAVELAWTHLDEGAHERAAEQLEEVLEMLRVLGQEEGETAALALHGLGTCRLQHGDFDAAEELFLRALELHERLFGPGDSQYAVAVQNLGDLYLAQGRYDLAERELLRALETRRAAGQTLRLGAAQNLRNLGDSILAQGRFGDARAPIAEARDAFTLLLGPDHPRTVNCAVKLAICLRRVGEVEQAARVLEEELPRRAALEARGDSDARNALHSLGVLAQGLGRPADAAELFESCLAASDSVDPTPTPGRAGTLVNLAGARHSAGDVSGAEAAAAEAIEYLRTLPEGERPYLGLGLFILGRCAQERGDDAAAVPHLREALPLQLATAGEESAQSAEYLHALGASLFRTGRPEEGKELLRRALAVKRVFYPPGHARLVATQSVLLEVLEARGETAEATVLAAELAAGKQGG